MSNDKAPSGASPETVSNGVAAAASNMASGAVDSAGKALLENAYELNTADDSRHYYDQLAEHYDQDLAAGLAYRLPAEVQIVFDALRAADDVPVLDVGCGTGLLGEALVAPAPASGAAGTDAALTKTMDIDGADISPAMLEICGRKRCYRSLYEVDLTASVDSICNEYGAVLSSGTFTHGHLGTKPFTALLELAKSGALFVIAINRAHFEKLGFDKAIDAILADGRVHSLSKKPVNIYGKTDHEHEHGSDEAFIVSFRKA